MNKSIKISLIIGFGMIYMASLSGLALAQDYLTGSALNTSAGSPVLLSAKTTLTTEKVDFRVEKPDGLVVTMSGDVSSDGQAKVLMDGYHTTEAGHYNLEVSQGNLTDNVGFDVFPASVDADKSQVSISNQLADLNSNIQGSVTLEDKFGNLVEGHQVKVISSRSDDTVNIPNENTDKNGNVNFTVLSTTSGVSYLSVLDLTDDVTLSNRAKIIFANNNGDVAAIGGDLIPQAMAQTTTTPGPFYAFDLSGFPDNIQPNQNVSFTVKAVDQNGIVVPDYTGTVRFSAEGDNSSAVSLPSNYTFLASDLGVHQFDLGLSFTTAGTYTVIASDLSDKFKQGQKVITVGQAGSSGSTTTPTSSQQITITTPSAGTYSQAIQTISGTTISNYQVEIFDNNQSLGKVTADVSGKYTFQTQTLTDGDHEIYVNAIDPVSQQVQSTSTKIKITIDTIPPKIDQLDIQPSGAIKPGDVITIKVYSEKNLQQAVALFNYNIVPLNPTTEDPSVYVGQIAAPQQAGDYPVDINLVDELGNEATFSKQADVNVSGTSASVTSNVPTSSTTGTGTTPTSTTGSTTGTTGTSTTGTTTGSTANQVGLPSTVTGLVAYGSDKKVTLVWDAATDDQKIQNYKVYYGQTLTNLDQSVMTKDASTTWYVPNLENGKEYFFAVSAIDNQGNESAAKSEIVSGIPFVLEVNNALNANPNVQPLPTPDLHAAAYSGPFPTQAPATGPELFGVVLLAGALGKVFTKKK